MVIESINLPIAQIPTYGRSCVSWNPVGYVRLQTRFSHCCTQCIYVTITPRGASYGALVVFLLESLHTQSRVNRTAFIFIVAYFFRKNPPPPPLPANSRTTFSPKNRFPTRKNVK